VQRRPMLDLSLFRKPTFSGGLIAAFGISASLFSLLTYVVLYLQNQLGYSALETGLRTLFLTGAIFLTAGIAGRLTTVVPVRVMISAGFVLIGTGLLLMHGITTTSGWTHLIPGLILAGVGAGLVNVPLASTSVGVVEPARAGMASGINATLRQVGIATGIATLGSLFSARIRDTVTDRLLESPLAPQAHAIADGVGGGGSGGAPAGAGGEQGRQIIASAARAGFVDGLNEIVLVGAGIALVAAVASLLLIRGRDFVDEPGADERPESDTRPEPDTRPQSDTAAPGGPGVPGTPQPTHS